MGNIRTRTVSKSISTHPSDYTVYSNVELHFLFGWLILCPQWDLYVVFGGTEKGLPNRRSTHPFRYWFFLNQIQHQKFVFRLVENNLSRHSLGYKVWRGEIQKHLDRINVREHVICE